MNIEKLEVLVDVITRLIDAQKAFEEINKACEEWRFACSCNCNACLKFANVL